MHQRTRAGLLTTLVAAMAGSTFAALPAVDAVEADGSYTFLDCDIDIQITRWDPSFEVTDLTAELAEWTTEVSVDLPNPAPAGHGAVKVDLGMMPTGFRRPRRNARPAHTDQRVSRRTMVSASPTRRSSVSW